MSLISTLREYSLPTLLGSGIFGPCLFLIPGFFIPINHVTERPTMIWIVGMSLIFFIAAAASWIVGPAKLSQRALCLIPVTTCLAISTILLIKSPDPRAEPNQGPPMRAPTLPSQSGRG